MPHPDTYAKPVKICLDPAKHDVVWGQVCPSKWRVVYSVDSNDEAWRLINSAAKEMIITHIDGRYRATERTPGTLNINIFSDELKAVHQRNKAFIELNSQCALDDRSSDYVGYETADLVKA